MFGKAEGIKVINFGRLTNDGTNLLEEWLKDNKDKVIINISMSLAANSDNRNYTVFYREW